MRQKQSEKTDLLRNAKRRSSDVRDSKVIKNIRVACKAKAGENGNGNETEERSREKNPSHCKLALAATSLNLKLFSL